MTTMVALLRGVNVGGRGKLPMADLRRIVEGCGFDAVRTYIQSGNVVFETTERSAPKVEDRLAAALAAETDLKPGVVVRTAAQLAKVVDANPFLARGEDPAHLHVVFVGGKAKATTGDLDLAAYAPEEAAAVGQELHLFLPGGIGRSKLANDLGRVKVDGDPVTTTRNWRTVTTLLAMAGDG